MIVGVNPQFPIVTHNIINTHFFHGNIWTHNWPAPNVSGFIAQLLEHRTGNREVTGSNPVEVLKVFQASLRNCINCVHCDDHFFIFISFLQFIYDLFHISLTKLIFTEIITQTQTNAWTTLTIVAKMARAPTPKGLSTVVANQGTLGMATTVQVGSWNSCLALR